MISFRYHLLSIVAVFLALALGVVAGTTVIDQGLVDRLEQQTANANRSAELARDKAGASGAELSRAVGFTDQALPLLTAGKLAGARIVLVTDEGTDKEVVDSVENSVATAGADVTAVISTTPAAATPDVKSREALALLLGVPQTSTSGALAAEMAAQLASRLVDGVRGDQDLLYQLLESGFLQAGKGSGLKEVNGQLSGIGGPDQSVVVVSGGVGVPSLDPSSFLEPLTGNLVRQDAHVAAAEPGSAEYQFVADLRDSGLPDSKEMVTVDNADEAAGELALVIATQALLRGDGGGDYGFKAGAADGLFPPLAP